MEVGIATDDIPIRADLVIYDPVYYQQTLIIEAKTQNTNGSAYKNMWHFADQVKRNRYPTDVILVMEGKYYDDHPGIRREMKEKLPDSVFDLQSFDDWVEESWGKNPDRKTWESKNDNAESCPDEAYNGPCADDEDMPRASAATATVPRTVVDRKPLPIITS